MSTKIQSTESLRFEISLPQGADAPQATVCIVNANFQAGRRYSLCVDIMDPVQAITSRDVLEQELLGVINRIYAHAASRQLPVPYAHDTAEA